MSPLINTLDEVRQDPPGPQAHQPGHGLRPQPAGPQADRARFSASSPRGVSRAERTLRTRSTPSRALSGTVRAMSTGAQVIVDELERAGVEVCFGLPGVHNLALWAALRESSIRLVGVRHEQAAAYAADGYARATGKLGVAITTTGPGAANTLGAVGEAWASRSPILVIATDIPSGLRRPGEYRGILHETDGQAAMFASVVKSVHVGARGRRGGAGDRGRGALGGRGADPPRVPGDRDRPARGVRAERVRGARGVMRNVTAYHAEPDLSAADRRDRRRAPAAHLGRRRRAGRRRRRARPRRAALRARPHHLRRGGHPPARAPVTRRAPAARRGRRTPVGRGRRRDRDRVRPRRRADAELRPAAARDADRHRPRGADELPRRRARRRRRERRGRARRSRRAARRRARPRRRPRRGLLRPRRRRAALPGRDALRRARRRQRRRRHVHPRLLDGRVLHALRPRAGCRSRSAGGRSATRSRPRSAPR